MIFKNVFAAGYKIGFYIDQKEDKTRLNSAVLLFLEDWSWWDLVFSQYRFLIYFDNVQILADTKRWSWKWVPSDILTHPPRCQESYTQIHHTNHHFQWPNVQSYPWLDFLSSFSLWHRENKFHSWNVHFVKKPVLSATW